MYEILTLGIITYGILIGCFAILSREQDKLQRGYNSLLQENKELRASNIELIDANISLISKRNSLNVNEFGMSKNK
jgi:hypothetical protein